MAIVVVGRCAIIIIRLHYFSFDPNILIEMASIHHVNSDAL